MKAESASTHKYEEIDSLIEQFIATSRLNSKLDIDAFVKQYPAWEIELRDLLPAAIALESKRASTDFSIKCAAFPSICDYRFIQELGRGGMGIVYKAEHAALSRMVAVKVLSPSLLPNAKARERFQREAKATARLHHTNIVPVFEVGQSEEHAFYSMQLIEGENLDERIKRELALAANESAPSRLNVRIARAAKLGVDIARALQHAHDHQILHRDVKPSNILIDRDDEVWLSDFGLASISDGQVTQSQDLVGTLRYLAPERLLGVCDVQSDIYSLGLTLYEQVTLSPALFGLSKEVLLSPNRNTPPIRNYSNNIPKDFATIVDKAIHSQPSARYASASHLADDLQAFLESKPISARPVSGAEKLLMWGRRNPAVATLILSLNCLLLIVAIASSIAASQFRTLSIQAEESRIEAENSKNIAQEKESEARKMAGIAKRNEESASRVANFFSRMIQGADPSGLLTGHARTSFKIDQSTTAFEWIRQSSKMIDEESFDELPLVEAQLKDTLGVALTGQMRMKEARPLLEQSLELRSKYLSADDLDLAASLDHLGTYCFYSGDPQAAEEKFRKALSIREDWVERASTQNQSTFDDVKAKRLEATRTKTAMALAMAYSKRDRSELAVEILKETLATRIQLLREDHEDVAYAHIALASIMARNLDSADAIQEVHKAETILQKTKGDQRLTQVFSLYAQGTAFQAMKMTDLAIQRFKEAGGLLGEVFGPNHPLTIYARGEIAGALERAGKGNEAVELYRQVIVDNEQAMADQPYLAQSWDTLGICLRYQEKIPEATEAFSKALEVYKAAGLQAPHVLLANTQLRLADCYNLSARIDDSYDLLRDSVLQLEQLPKESTGHQIGHSLHFMAYLAMLHLPHHFPEVAQIATRVCTTEDRYESLEMLLRAGTSGQCTMEQAQVFLETSNKMESLADNPQWAQTARFLRGRALWQLGRTEEALKLLAEDQDNELRSYQSQLYKSLCLFKQGNESISHEVFVDAVNSIVHRLPKEAASHLATVIGDEIKFDPNTLRSGNEITYAWEQAAYAKMVHRLLNGP